MLPFIVIGLTSGAVYAIAGIGVVLTYRTSGVFNFAHGAVAAISAYVFYSLYVASGWSWPVAALLAIAVPGPLLGLLLEPVARRIAAAPLPLRIATTVGLLLAIEAGIQLIYGNEVVRTVPIFLGVANVRIAGTNVQIAQLVTFSAALAITLGLSVFLRHSRRGTAMRAVVDDPDLLGLTGTSATATRRTAWVIGITLAAASGVLFAPLLPLDPVQLTLLVASAFGAAAIGAFSSLPLTFAGGLGIGVLASLCTKWFSTGLLSGLPPALPFVALLIVVLAFPRRLAAGEPLTLPRYRPAWRAPPALHLVAGVAAIAALVFVPAFVGVHLTDWTAFLASSIVFMSLGFLVKTAGEVPLSQVAFMAIGATAFSHLTLGAGLPWLPALILSGLLAVPVGGLVAIPAVRLSGLYLALGTFAFGILLEDMFYSEGYMFGPNGVALPEPRPHLSWLAVGTDSGFYYLTLALAVLAAFLVVALTRGRLGRLLRGAAESPRAIGASGANVGVARLLAFCIAAFLAAVGGTLAGVAEGSVVAQSYQPVQSLTYFAAIVVIAGSAPWNALLAAAGLTLVPSYLPGERVTTLLQLFFGAGAIAFALGGAEPALPAFLTRAIDASFGRLGLRRARRQTVRALPACGPAESRLRTWRLGDGGGGTPLLVDRVVVRYGGLLALDSVSLDVAPGRIVGLVGPNGAGKTTLINVCTGSLRGAGGRVLIGARDVSRRSPSARARLGLGRTFQHIELLDSLTVRENVELGAEAALAGANPVSQIVGRAGQSAAVRLAASDAMSLCDIAALADRRSGTLSTAERRLVELARCLAGPFELLLLDEPSAGLDLAETRHVAEILRRVVTDRQLGVLLVEHNVSLVLDLCDHVYVLDFGSMLIHGAPQAVVRSPLVRSAYLGTVPDGSVAALRRTP